MNYKILIIPFVFVAVLLIDRPITKLLNNEIMKTHNFDMVNYVIAADFVLLIALGIFSCYAIFKLITGIRLNKF